MFSRLQVRWCHNAVGCGSWVRIRPAEEEGGLRHAHHAEEVQREHCDEGGVHRLPEQDPAESCREDLQPDIVLRGQTPSSRSAQQEVLGGLRAFMKREVRNKTSTEG